MANIYKWNSTRTGDQTTEIGSSTILLTFYYQILAATAPVSNNHPFVSWRMRWLAQEPVFSMWKVICSDRDSHCTVPPGPQSPPRRPPDTLSRLLLLTAGILLSSTMLDTPHLLRNSTSTQKWRRHAAKELRQRPFWTLAMSARKRIWDEY